MFRKRIASSGVLALSTLAAGLILPSVIHPRVASAQVMDMDDDDDEKVIDMDEGEGVIDLDGTGPTGPAAVAGEPTSTMSQAKAAFDGKRWAEAAQGFHSVVSGSSGDDAGNVQMAEFYLAQSLYFLKFYQSSFDGFAKIAKNPQHLK